MLTITGVNDVHDDLPWAFITGEGYVLVKCATVFHVTTDYLLGLDKAETIDVSDLDSGDIEILRIMAERLRRKDTSTM